MYHFTSSHFTPTGAAIPFRRKNGTDSIALLACCRDKATDHKQLRTNLVFVSWAFHTDGNLGFCLLVKHYIVGERQGGYPTPSAFPIITTLTVPQSGCFNFCSKCAARTRTLLCMKTTVAPLAHLSVQLPFYTYRNNNNNNGAYRMTTAAAL